MLLLLLEPGAALMLMIDGRDACASASCQPVLSVCGASLVNSMLLSTTIPSACVCVRE